MLRQNEASESVSWTPPSLSPVWLYPKVPHWEGELRAGRQLLRDAPSPDCLGPWCGNFRDLTGLPSLKRPSSESGDVSKVVGWSLWMASGL